MRSLVKSLIYAIANLAALPFLLLHVLKVPLVGPDRALESSTELLSLIPGLTGNYLRRAFLGWTIQKCHPSASIGFGTVFSKGDASIAENVYIGSRCQLGKAHIGRDALIASGVHITSGSKMHNFDDPDTPIREQGGTFERVRIGEGSWIGSLAVVMADVGDGCVVGAGAVVTKPIPAWSIAGGIPAKVIRERAKPI